jgi:hypothetical protein
MTGKVKVIMALFLVVLLTLAAGCGGESKAGKKMIKVEVTGDELKGSKVFGSIRADDPGGAGFSSKTIEIVVPGSVETLCGPANYDVRFMAWSTKKLKCHIYMDGQEMLPPKLLIEAREGEYSAMFTIDKEAQK